MNLRLSIMLFAAACAACSQNGMPQQNSSQAGAAASADRSAGSGSSGSAVPSAQASGSSSSRAALAESKPQFKEVTIPSGTTMAVKLENSVASDSSKVEDA